MYRSMVSSLLFWFMRSQICLGVVAAFLFSFFRKTRGELRLNTIVYTLCLFWIGYYFTKYRGIFWRSGKHMRLFVISAVILLLFGWVFLGQFVFFKNLIIILLGWLYNKNINKFTLRNVPLLKNFHIAITWGLCMAWLFEAYFRVANFAMSFLYIFALIIPFDIRDRKEDAFVTFPKYLGERNAKQMAIFCLLVSCVIAFLSLPKLSVFAWILANIFSGILIWKTNGKESCVYYSIVLELCIALPALFLFLMEHIAYQV